jgi:hypothetical protein
MEIKIAVKNQDTILSESKGNHMTTLVYAEEYCSGDYIELQCSEAGFYQIQLEDTLPPTLVYINGEVKFEIPIEEASKRCYSPRAFVGLQHLITAKKAEENVVRMRRNLAYNPHDQSGIAGMYPHALANVVTRNETIFVARNAIDGIFANTEHYFYPYQSWGINRDPNAWLKVEFGVPVDLDEIIITLRADYPHDSYWIKATIEFSDGSEETVSLEKLGTPQAFPVQKEGITWMRLKELIKAEDESPFPALTQIEAWGCVK